MHTCALREQSIWIVLALVLHRKWSTICMESDSFYFVSDLDIVVYNISDHVCLCVCEMVSTLIKGHSIFSIWVWLTLSESRLISVLISNVWTACFHRYVYDGVSIDTFVMVQQRHQYIWISIAHQKQQWWLIRKLIYDKPFGFAPLHEYNSKTKSGNFLF